MQVWNINQEGWGKKKNKQTKPQSTLTCADISMRTLISKDLCTHRPPWLFAFLTLHAHFSASLLVPVNINSCSWPQNTKPTLHKKYTLHIDHLISQVNITRVFLLNYSFTQCKFYNCLQHFKKAFKMHFLNYILFFYLHFTLQQDN